MPRQKLLIIGGHSRLGAALASEFTRHHEVRTVSRSELDLASPPQVIAQFLDGIDFDLLLLPAGITDVDYCERRPDESWIVNAGAPAHIAAYCARRGVRMIHFGTDYVFDGAKSTPYHEDDSTSPLSLYGKCKLAGERAVVKASPANLVVRLSWLFGPGKAGATPDWAVQFAMERDFLKIASDRVSTPTYTLDVAQALVPLLFDPRATGWLHMANAGACSWLEWAKFSIDTAVECGVQVRTQMVNGITMAEVFLNRALRPKYTVFSTEKFDRLTGHELPTWQDAVRRYVKETVVPRYPVQPLRAVG